MSTTIFLSEYYYYPRFRSEEIGRERVRLAPGPTAGGWWNLNPDDMTLARTACNTFLPFSCLLFSSLWPAGLEDKRGLNCKISFKAMNVLRVSTSQWESLSFTSKPTYLRNHFQHVLVKWPCSSYLTSKAYSFLNLGWRQYNLHPCYEQNNVPSPDLHIPTH